MPKDPSTIKSSNLAMLEFVARRLDELNIATKADATLITEI
jgi:hypothetical protein